MHHLEGHLLAPALEPGAPDFPFVALQVSGGHTMLVEVAGVGRYRMLGETQDDAAGEAFDKTAKLLGLAIPAGRRSRRWPSTAADGAFEFPRPMLDRPGLDFSFSGLKTAVVVAVRGRKLDDAARADVARGFEDAIVDTLVTKSLRALRQTGLDTLVVAGGVGANRRLRAALARGGRGRRRARALPAPGVLHRQRRDDRARRPPPPGRRRARRPAGARARPLATRRTERAPGGPNVTAY